MKATPIEDLDRQQTLLILPAAFMRQISTRHKVYFHELDMTTLVVVLVGPTERAPGKLYKLVSSRGASWVSVPQKWLRNIGAREGDSVDVYDTSLPHCLIFQHRKAGTLPTST